MVVRGIDNGVETIRDRIEIRDAILADNRVEITRAEGHSPALASIAHLTAKCCQIGPLNI